MKFRDCTSMNSTENIQEGYRNGLSKTALELIKVLCEQTRELTHDFLDYV